MFKKAAFLCLFLFPLSAFSASFRWNLTENDRLELVKTARINFLINNAVQRIYEERNIIDLTCYKTEETSYSLSGSFSVYTRDSESPVFRLTDKKFSEFTIDKYGKYSVPDKFIMPNLRHVPMFPEKELTEGDEWQAPVELYLDNFSAEVGLLLSAHYKFAGYADYNGEKNAVIEYSFSINKDLRSNKARHPDFPDKILGENKGVIYWNADKNQISGMNDKYRIIFAFLNGGSLNTYEFRMNIDTESTIYPPVLEKEKEKEKEDLKKDFPEDTGITVDTNENGIVLSMGEVLFDFDSSSLKREAGENLDKITGIIKKKYPDREIIIEGHTDNVGSRDYNMELSSKRAQNVAEYLKRGIDHDKLSFRGYGPDKPLNGNKTAEEKRKNRRVDIIIKLK